MDSLTPDLKWLYQVGIKEEVVDRNYPDRITLCKQIEELPAHVPVRVRIVLFIGLRILSEHQHKNFIEKYDRFCKELAIEEDGCPLVLDEDSEAPAPAPASNDISLDKEPETCKWDGNHVIRVGETSTLSASIRDSPPGSPYDMPSPNPTAERWAESLIQELVTDEPIQLAELLKDQDKSEIASMFYLASVLASDGKIKMTQDERGEVFVSKGITD